MSKEPIVIMWFRRDLRWKDNHALHQALLSGLPVLPVFIFDPDILDRLKDKADRRVNFIYDALQKMQDEISDLGFGLWVEHDLPMKAFTKMLDRFVVTAVYTNHDYEPYAIDRDLQVAGLLKSHGVKFLSFKDQVIFEKNEVTKDDKTPYTVFTPYKKKWLSRLSEKDLKSYPSEKYIDRLFKIKGHIPTLTEIGFQKTPIQFPSIKVRAQLLNEYDKDRDYPALEATSRLGVHFRFGTISIRNAVQTAQKINDVWLSELIWREFFMQILFHFPHVANGAFRKEYDQIKWRNNKEEFRAWCEGQTGYPIVDAGMRELNKTGHMHNRVRMITASFLTKDLLIDWRWGEAYFAEKLLDFDLSANNGNWQWAAGTGCDAAPYFRIFNPISQTEKFDPEFVYIKRWVPEFENPSYPKPIVDHGKARERTLAAYKEALKR